MPSSDMHEYRVVNASRTIKYHVAASDLNSLKDAGRNVLGLNDDCSDLQVVLDHSGRLITASEWRPEKFDYMERFMILGKEEFWTPDPAPRIVHIRPYPIFMKGPYVSPDVDGNGNSKHTGLPRGELPRRIDRQMRSEVDLSNACLTLASDLCSGERGPDLICQIQNDVLRQLHDIMALLSHTALTGISDHHLDQADFESFIADAARQQIDILETLESAVLPCFTSNSVPDLTSQVDINCSDRNTKRSSDGSSSGRGTEFNDEHSDEGLDESLEACADSLAGIFGHEDRSSPTDCNNTLKTLIQHVELDVPSAVKLIKAHITERIENSLKFLSYRLRSDICMFTEEVDCAEIPPFMFHFIQNMAGDLEQNFFRRRDQALVGARLLRLTGSRRR